MAFFSLSKTNSIAFNFYIKTYIICNLHYLWSNNKIKHVKIAEKSLSESHRQLNCTICNCNCISIMPSPSSRVIPTCLGKSFKNTNVFALEASDIFLSLKSPWGLIAYQRGCNKIEREWVCVLPSWKNDLSSPWLVGTIPVHKNGHSHS